jgi:hypothetical protein
MLLAVCQAAHHRTKYQWCYTGVHRVAPLTPNLPCAADRLFYTSDYSDKSLFEFIVVIATEILDKPWIKSEI